MYSNKETLKKAFLKEFDIVGMIDVKTYQKEAYKRKLTVPEMLDDYHTLVVFGLAYQTKHPIDPLHSVAFFAHGQDYHKVLTQRAKNVINHEKIKDALIAVDVNPLNERLCATLAGLGYIGKNQCLITPKLGSFINIGTVLLKEPMFEEDCFLYDDCSTCQICIQACPTHALDEGFHKRRCLSYLSQRKMVIPPEDILLFERAVGCDICQTVCPRNINIHHPNHIEYELNGNEKLDFHALATMSNKTFKTAYSETTYAYLGRLTLVRNLACLAARHNDTTLLRVLKKSYEEIINVPWYTQTLAHVLTLLEGEHND